jgi:hypothetical protein
MKVAIYSESSADEAVVRVLVDGLLGQVTEPVGLPLRHRGWPSVRDLLPTVLKHLHYQTDANALVVVVDSDKDPIHRPTHDEPGTEDLSCRLCVLRKTVELARNHLRPVEGRSPIRTAIGLAVPCIEAWWRCGHDPAITEAAWAVCLNSRKFTYDCNRLKQAVYDTDRPPLTLEMRRMVEEATRLARTLPELERWFEDGFGALAREVRSWQPPPASPA